MAEIKSMADWSDAELERMAQASPTSPVMIVGGPQDGLLVQGFVDQFRNDPKMADIIAKGSSNGAGVASTDGYFGNGIYNILDKRSENSMRTVQTLPTAQQAAKPTEAAVDDVAVVKGKGVITPADVALIYSVAQQLPSDSFFNKGKDRLDREAVFNKDDMTLTTEFVEALRANESHIRTTFAKKDVYERMETLIDNLGSKKHVGGDTLSLRDVLALNYASTSYGRTFGTETPIIEDGVITEHFNMKGPLRTGGGLGSGLTTQDVQDILNLLSIPRVPQEKSEPTIGAPPESEIIVEAPAKTEPAPVSNVVGEVVEGENIPSSLDDNRSEIPAEVEIAAASAVKFVAPEPPKNTKDESEVSEVNIPNLQMQEMARVARLLAKKETLAWNNWFPDDPKYVGSVVTAEWKLDENFVAAAEEADLMNGKPPRPLRLGETADENAPDVKPVTLRDILADLGQGATTSSYLDSAEVDLLAFKALTYEVRGEDGNSLVVEKGVLASTYTDHVKHHGEVGYSRANPLGINGAPLSIQMIDEEIKKEFPTASLLENTQLAEKPQTIERDAAVIFGGMMGTANADMAVLDGVAAEHFMTSHDNEVATIHAAGEAAVVVAAEPSEREEVSEPSQSVVDEANVDAEPRLPSAGATMVTISKNYNLGLIAEPAGLVGASSREIIDYFDEMSRINSIDAKGMDITNELHPLNNIKPGDTFLLPNIVGRTHFEYRQGDHDVDMGFKHIAANGQAPVGKADAAEAQEDKRVEVEGDLQLAMKKGDTLYEVVRDLAKANNVEDTSYGALKEKINEIAQASGIVDMTKIQIGKEVEISGDIFGEAKNLNIPFELQDNLLQR